MKIKQLCEIEAASYYIISFAELCCVLCKALGVSSSLHSVARLGPSCTLHLSCRRSHADAIPPPEGDVTGELSKTKHSCFTKVVSHSSTSTTKAEALLLRTSQVGIIECMQPQTHRSQLRMLKGVINCVNGVRTLIGCI